MNIFYVDKDPVKAAKMLLDKHVVKMILECAQMLCTAKRVLDGTEYMAKTKNGRNIKRWKLDNSNEEAIIYKAGWLNHPSTQWVLQSAYNYIWLYKHMMALGDEYTKRYGKVHLTIEKLGDLLKHPPKNSPINKKGYDATPAMPDECKIPGDVVASYRKYYIFEKQRFATWKSPSTVPAWYIDGVKEAQEQALI